MQAHKDGVSVLWELVRAESLGPGRAHRRDRLRVLGARSVLQSDGREVSPRETEQAFNAGREVILVLDTAAKNLDEVRIGQTQSIDVGGGLHVGPEQDDLTRLLGQVNLQVGFPALPLEPHDLRIAPIGRGPLDDLGIGAGTKLERGHAWITDENRGTFQDIM